MSHELFASLLLLVCLIVCAWSIATDDSEGDQ